ncbi:LytTR family DNA-binding domain-containing protein [Marivirga harenae]|uniref:LytR/AlgR family response regulator transcription factor n=1 Tax=Marivirga harenae TaxID=2010992 RepID=UPI0026E0A779|nr:LytTR family DNA-binding domain-containing protein [Marivirga harenae]WKV13555.1 LytTR family DNA-binding domain-containing protein [Marivirga harenae]|tara:strand:+ start:196113 stop:196868 length:756 start_codon:yes stop_codon:yes gene_type:complete
MNAVIIEDEKLAAQKLESMLSKIQPSLKIIKLMGSIEEAVEFFQNEVQVDLVFLDIHLSDGSSFNIFDQVEITAPIIFTTAYDEYALKAFKVNSIDYLLKPIAQSDLRAALDKLMNISANGSSNDIEKLITAFRTNQAAHKQRFLLTYGSQIKSIRTEDTAYFYADNKMVFLVNQDGHKYVTDETMDQIEAVLDPMEFFRVNRTFLIGINSITKMNTYSRSRIKIDLVPACEKECIVSTEKCADFKRWLGK